MRAVKSPSVIYNGDVSAGSWASPWRISLYSFPLKDVNTVQSELEFLRKPFLNSIPDILFLFKVYFIDHILKIHRHY